MQQVAGGAVQVEALGCRIRGNQDAYGRFRVVERRLHAFPLGCGHARQFARAASAEQGADALRIEPFAQAPGQIVQRRLVFGEDDQALVLEEGIASEQQPLDQLGEGVEAGVGAGRLFADRLASKVESQSAERLFDAARVALHVGRVVRKPGAGDGGRGGGALFRLEVVAGLLAPGAFRRGQRRSVRRRLRQALPRPSPGFRERRRAGEQALAENLHREVAGPLPSARVGRRQSADRLAEGIERGAEFPFAGVEGQRDRLRWVAAAESSSVGAGVDVALESPHHDICRPPAHGRGHLARAGEAHRVQHFQEARERAGVAVVRGGGEEQAMLELRRHLAQHPAQATVLAHGRRHQVVALVHNEQVPRQVRGTIGRLAGGEEALEHVRLAQVVVGGDDAAEQAPRVRVHAQLAACGFGALAIHHLEIEGELLLQFVAPLRAERCRREHQHPANAAANEEFGEHETGFHGLAEAHVVGEQQAHARHPQRLQERPELVVLHPHRAVERAGQRHPVQRAVAVWVQVGNQCAPAGGAKQGVEVRRRHRGAQRIRQRRGFHEPRAGFAFPQQALVRRLASVLVFEMDEVQPPCLAVERLHGGHHAVAVAHRGKQAHAGHGDGGRLGARQVAVALRHCSCSPTTSTNSATTATRSSSSAVSRMGSNAGLSGPSVIATCRQPSSSAVFSLR